VRHDASVPKHACGDAAIKLAAIGVPGIKVRVEASPEAAVGELPGGGRVRVEASPDAAGPDAGAVGDVHPAKLRAAAGKWTAGGLGRSTGAVLMTPLAVA